MSTMTHHLLSCFDKGSSSSHSKPKIQYENTSTSLSKEEQNISAPSSSLLKVALPSFPKAELLFSQLGRGDFNLEVPCRLLGLYGLERPCWAEPMDRQAKCLCCGFEVGLNFQPPHCRGTPCWDRSQFLLSYIVRFKSILCLYLNWPSEALRKLGAERAIYYMWYQSMSALNNALLVVRCTLLQKRFCECQRHDKATRCVANLDWQTSEIK